MNEQIDEVLSIYPWIYHYGCDPCDRIPDREVLATIDYLSDYVDDKSRSSYSLKHDAERATIGYIRDRAFLVGAAIYGYRLVLRDDVAYLT